MPELHHEIGRHEAQIEQLLAKVERMESKVDRIELTLSEARGGWRMLMAVGGISGLVGAGITKALHSVGINTP